MLSQSSVSVRPVAAVATESWWLVESTRWIAAPHRATLDHFSGNASQLSRWGPRTSVQSATQLTQSRTHKDRRLVPPTKDNKIGICKFMAAYTIWPLGAAGRKITMQPAKCWDSSTHKIKDGFWSHSFSDWRYLKVCTVLVLYVPKKVLMYFNSFAKGRFVKFGFKCQIARFSPHMKRKKANQRKGFMPCWSLLSCPWSW